MIPDLSSTTRAHLAIQRDNTAPVSLIPKRCGCGARAFTKQLAQHGKCSTCLFVDLVATLDREDVDKLRHALGATPHHPRSHWGFRNHYCCGLQDLAAMQRLVAAGFMTEGRQLLTSTYFYATRAGCKLAGLTSAGTKRALGE